MQKITYFCDRCGKQIEKTVCQLATIRIILPGDGSIGMTSEDIDTGGEDHIYDETRYFLMSRPIAPRAAVRRKAKGFDPLAD